jgi:hypothetical protein
MMEATEVTDPPRLPLASYPGVRWFAPHCCVVARGDEREVFVRGVLIGRYDAETIGARNALVVGLAEDPDVHLGQLADAFDISAECLRLLRRQREGHGLAAVVNRARRGRQRRLTPDLQRRLERLFDQGLSAAEAHARVSRRTRISERSVERARQAWRRARPEGAVTPPPPPEPEAQASLLIVTTSGEASASATPQPAASTSTEPAAPAVVDGEVRSAPFVQHLGTWLMLSMLAQQELYKLAEQRCATSDEPLDPCDVRVAIDAFAAALSLGQGCVEGVRRLETQTAPQLLRCDHAPSPPWVRSTLGRLADTGAIWLHLGMAGRHARAARAAHDDERAVFYVDNHLRPYTGKFTIRRGWRMQDKRVRPGSTDYYVHDEDGRPVWRYDAPEHGSLVQWLEPVAGLLRIALGSDERILLAFDRAGAFPEALASLREEGFEFVTYERRPYQQLAASAFDHTLVLDDETLAYCEQRANLGGGRGRVRRIAVRNPDGSQINLLCVSEAPAERLIEIMRGRWRQENGFKHGVERWGANQLDARQTEPYPPETIIPNPARRRLDRALRLAHVREGDVRCRLAELDQADRRRPAVEHELADAIAFKQQILTERPTVPKHAPLRETELAGKLVRHRPDYKMTLDTVRIACANIEADLAAVLAPHLLNPAEAKKTLANLLAAPGHVSVQGRRVHVELLPAGTARERAAFGLLLVYVNRLNLTLPGDPQRRRLAFRSQLS